MKTVFGSFSVMLAVFSVSGNARAAFADSGICSDPDGSCGYYLAYEGRLAGFTEWDLQIGGAVLGMSIDPTIYEPTPPNTPVTLYDYADVMVPGSGFTAQEQVKLSQIGALMYDMFLSPGFFNSDGVTPPTECVAGYENCSGLSAEVNSVTWNIWSPSSVPMSTESADVFTSYTSGTYDAFDWTTAMVLMAIDGGDTFVIPLGGASPETLSSVPVPQAAWLFGAGLIGLLGAARRKAG